MATEYKIIKIRRGTRATFIPSTLLPGELWMSTDTGEAFFCYSAGNYKQFATFEDMVEFVKGVNEEIILELTDEINQATTNANQATTYANQAGDYANSKGDYADQKGQEAQAIVDSAAPIINTNLQATYADKATQTGEYLHVEVADNALVQITELKGKSTQVITETSPSPDEPSPILSVGDSDFEIVSCGKNLLRSEAKSSTHSGIIYTVNSDGSITANGTSTAESNVVIRLKNYDIRKGTYTLSGKTTNVFVRILDSKAINVVTLSFQSGTFTVDEDLSNCYVQAVIPQGKTVINETIYPQLELGSTATEYEPYEEDRITIDTTNQKFRGFQSEVKDGYGFKDGEFGYWQRVGTTTRTTSGSISGAKTNSQYMCNISPVGNLSGTTFTMPSGGANAIVQYELATPIFTPLPEIYLKSYKGITNIFTTASIQPELTGTFKSELRANEYNTEKNIGLLENLDTANKDNLVGAINETNEIAVNASYNVSEQFDSSKTYVVGDYMIRNNTLFRCKVEIPVAKPFDFNDWEATTVGKEMTTANDNVAKLTNRNYIFIGDSYGAATDSWIDKMAAILGLSSDKYYKGALGGAGFNPITGKKLFLDLLKELTIADKNKITDIIVCGGYNDADNVSNTSGILKGAISSFMAYCKTNFPNATVYVGMIGSNSALTTDGVNIRDRLARVVYYGYSQCSQYGAVCLNGVQNILKNYSFIKGDFIHPSTSGDVVLANGIYNAYKGGYADVFYPYEFAGFALDSKFSSITTVQPFASQVANNVTMLQFLRATFTYSSTTTSYTCNTDLVLGSLLLPCFRSNGDNQINNCITSVVIAYSDTYYEGIATMSFKVDGTVVIKPLWIDATTKAYKVLPNIKTITINSIQFAIS